ncbi:MAG TPA: MarR family transcriptional regulator [Thermoleophilaceae bacterium]|nr:MarR family transcriptional regulator [Thermoleophilaceae bacterium]
MTTKTDTTSVAVAQALPHRTARLNRLLWRHSDGILTRTEAGVLSTLSDGPRRVTELADMEGLAQPTITVLVGKMESAGLVQRERDESDGRVVLVNITEAGRVALERLRAQYREVLHERMASMSDEEVAALRAATDALGALVDALQQGRTEN